MKMTNDTKDDLALEALFDSARADDPSLTPNFLARLEADADAAIAAQTIPAPGTAANPGFWSRFATALFPVSGLAAATLAGVWIGFQVPSTDFASALALGDTEDFDVSAFLPAVALSGFSDEGIDG